MKLVAGLGNPGRKYDGTRHNVGFDVVERLAQRHRADWEMAPRGVEALVARWRAAETVLAKPLTYMNLSGPAIVGLLNFYKVDPADLLVVVDDTNLELGRLRARGAGTAGGHNGLKSIIAALGTTAFARLRVGVGRGDARRDLADHVLAKFEPGEREIVEEATARSAEAAELFLAEGMAAVMNRFNRWEEKDAESKGHDATRTREDRE